MKLTVFAFLLSFLVFIVAGVQPLDEYRESVLALFVSANSVVQPADNLASTPIAIPETPPIESQVITPSTVPASDSTGVNSQAGEYGTYYLGLVKNPDGVLRGNDGYGEFIVLINNKYANNPTYAELLIFLEADKTDQFPYQYLVPASGFFYGEPEDKINLERIKKIIDGLDERNSPLVCSDFAERLHNNAEMAGIRSGYVSLALKGYSDPDNLGIGPDAGHALNVFETTDRGLVYIDCTGTTNSYGPLNSDKVVNVQISQPYNPEFLFPNDGWYIPDGVMGDVAAINITWDGDWR